MADEPLDQRPRRRLFGRRRVEAAEKPPDLPRVTVSESTAPDVALPSAVTAPEAPKTDEATDADPVSADSSAPSDPSPAQETVAGDAEAETTLQDTNSSPAAAAAEDEDAEPETAEDENREPDTAGARPTRSTVPRSRRNRRRAPLRSSPPKRRTRYRPRQRASDDRDHAEVPDSAESPGPPESSGATEPHRNDGPDACRGRVRPTIRTTLRCPAPRSRRDRRRAPKRPNPLNRPTRRLPRRPRAERTRRPWSRPIPRYPTSPSRKPTAQPTSAAPVRSRDCRRWTRPAAPRTKRPASCRSPGSSRSPTRRAAWVRPPPPSTWGPRSPKRATACSWSTSTRRATPRPVSGSTTATWSRRSTT